MKKYLLITASLLALAASPARAEDVAKKQEHAPPPGSHMLEEADTNKDGTISKEEFLESSAKRFAEIDNDGDGKITPAEIEARRAEFRAKMKEMREKRRAQSGKTGEKTKAPAASEAPAKDETPAE